MKGIWFTAKGKTEFLEEPEPKCMADTVLLKTLYSGLSNGTERNKLMGGNYSKGSWPDRIAYQHVSEVIECGENISRFQVGDIVFTATYPGHVPYHLVKETDLIIPKFDSYEIRKESSDNNGLRARKTQNVQWSRKSVKIT